MREKLFMKFHLRCFVRITEPSRETFKQFVAGPYWILWLFIRGELSLLCVRFSPGLTRNCCMSAYGSSQSKFGLPKS